MPSHYETLGVTPDAKEDDIRKAFRRAAKQHHPDKGGDVAKMAEVNEAYAVLSDPERREHYNAFGESAPIQTIDQLARSRLLQIFGGVINSPGNYVVQAKRYLQQARSKIQSETDALNAEIDKLRKRRAKIKCKASENLLGMVLDQKIAQGEQQLESVKREAEVAKRALEMLVLYNDEQIESGSAVFFATSSMRSW